MLIKLDNPKLLLDVISIISELVTEVKIKVNESGMNITAIDPANVALISFKLPKEGFSQFETGDEVLGVNLDNLKSILRRAKAGSSLIMQTQENFLRMEIIDKVKREFMLALIDIEAEDKELPSLEFSHKIEINSGDFIDVVEDSVVVGDTCTINSIPNKFTIESKGLHSTKAEFSSDEVKIEAEGEEPAISKYSLEYLQKFIKAGKLADQIKLSFAKDYPLRLDFNKDDMQLAFVLAPRVENED